MADPRAFISFDIDHNSKEKVLFPGQAKNSKTPFNIEDWSVKKKFPESNWKAQVREKIKRSNMVIVLVGKYMASADGVDTEITISNEEDVPFFGVYVGGANTNSNLPKGLARNHTISWDWDKISNAVDQMMKEGKNA